MLKGIDPVLSPDLLKTLCEMGHGDEIVFTDAHFPVASVARAGGTVYLRADGVDIPRLLKGLAPLFDLDKYATPVVMMAAEEGDTLDPKTEERHWATRAPSSGSRARRSTTAQSAPTPSSRQVMLPSMAT